FSPVRALFQREQSLDPGTLIKPKLFRSERNDKSGISDQETERGLACSSAGVIRIPFAQLAREAVCFLAVAGLAKGHGGFVQRARSDGWIVVKQSYAFESLAGVIEVSALQLDFAREQACFSVYAALGL